MEHQDIGTSHCRYIGCSLLITTAEKFTIGVLASVHGYYLESPHWGFQKMAVAITFTASHGCNDLFCSHFNGPAQRAVHSTIQKHITPLITVASCLRDTSRTPACCDKCPQLVVCTDDNKCLHCVRLHYYLFNRQTGHFDKCSYTCMHNRNQWWAWALPHWQLLVPICV